jgi:hypothetical protein
MKSFNEYISETKRLVRYDTMPRSGKAFVPRSDLYRFTADGSGSGRESSWGDYPKSSNDTLKKGLFTASGGHAAPYAMPRNTRWIRTGTRQGDEKPTLYISKTTKKSLRRGGHRTVASHYSVKQGFERTGEEEFFANRENVKPIRQEVHSNPLGILRKTHRIRAVKDLNAVKRRFDADGTHHEAEGSFD